MKVTYDIPFNKPYLTGDEYEFMKDAVSQKHLSGNGKYTKLCHQFFKDHFDLQNTLLTSSCTDALEMAAILINTKSGDEIIMPSFTFVSTANAFVLRGAKVRFADSMISHPNMDLDHVEKLITPKTKAIVCVHYAGVANDMDRLMSIASKHDLYVIEDAAHSIDSFYKNQRLGNIGDLSTFSFHETKNIISGEGGALIVNNSKFSERAEIIWEKGTNRSAFWRGEVDKYTWVDVGSSFLPSDFTAAFLYAQLLNYQDIQKKRKEIWQAYYDNLKVLENEGHCQLPTLPDFATNNGHLFYLILNDQKSRNELIAYLKSKGIYATFHYIPLHESAYYKKITGSDDVLPHAQRFAEQLIRLPLYFELSTIEQNKVIEEVLSFFK